MLHLVAACAALAGVTACDLGGFVPDRVTVTQLEPQAVGPSGGGGDPLVIWIVVRWTKDGWCSGQFTVQATETPTQVRVGVVTSREHHGGACAGVGTVDNMAGAELRLGHSDRELAEGTRRKIREGLWHRVEPVGTRHMDPELSR